MPEGRASRASRSTLLALWETRVGRLLQAVGIDDVRSAIVTLAVLATLIPALATGFLSYRQNQRAINAKLAEQLASLSTQSARELDLWLKDAIYNLRVFATSYEVTDNIERARTPGRGRLSEYLESVSERFPDYEELLVVGPDGRVAGTSRRQSGGLRLAGDWMTRVGNGDAVLGEPFRADSTAPIVMEMAVPIISPTGRFLGALAGRLNFRGVQQVLAGFLAGEREARLAVVDRQGRVIAATDSLIASLTEATLGRLERAEGEPMSYDSPRSGSVIATLSPLPRAGWSVIASIPRTAAFAEMRRLRNATILTTLILLVVVGALAYALALLIVRPLGRLSRAARQVAGGDLDVEVPAPGGGELAHLTTVFNDMVRRIRQGRDELEKLSVTDPLTGLANRRHMMAELDRELKRSDRQDRKCVIIMLDVDHFKKFNDTYGHQAGDTVLMHLADVLREQAREVDTPARYGGEEFLLIVPETQGAGAARLAERIRAKVADQPFQLNGGEPVTLTVSVGLAEFPAHGKTPEALISAADQALYKSKQAGRNRVTVAS